MKKILTALLFLLAMTNFAIAKTEINNSEQILTQKDVTVLKKGEAFSYPLPEDSIIECYAKRIDGSIDDFQEYNDYFVVKNNKLYSNTMHKIYKPNKNKQFKKVDRAKLINNGTTLQMYDPLWEWSIRHHMRVIKINTKTGDYYMNGTQDNWMWYRNITATGYCRVIYPNI